MRWTLAALPLLFAGCLGSPAAVFGADGPMDCTGDQRQIEAAQADFLLPAAMPQEAREPFGEARVTVHARAGQVLTAVAVWGMLSGEVDVLFDGPRANEVSVDQTWASSNGRVTSEGDYTLELVGDPMATQVSYTLYLVAHGCTPL